MTLIEAMAAKARAMTKEEIIEELKRDEEEYNRDLLLRIRNRQVGSGMKLR